MPKEEMPTVAEAPIGKPTTDVPLSLPTIAGQVSAALARLSDTEVPRSGDFTLVSSDQTTPVPRSGMDFKRESAEDRGQFTPGRSAELPRKISTDVYRVPAYASGMSSFGEMSPAMAMTLSGGSFEDHLPTRFSHMDSGLMNEAAEFCYDMMNEPREVFGSHPRLPRDVVERTDCRPQHTSIWAVGSRPAPPEKLTSSDSLPTVCEVLSSKESNKGMPAMANEIQTVDQHDISTQNIQGQKSRLAPMAQVFRPTTLDTCSPLCRTSKSSTVVPNFTEFKNTGSGVEKALGILSPAVTEGASVIVEGDHKSPCRARDSGEDRSSRMETADKRSLQLPDERGACLEPVMMKPSPPTAKEYFMSAGGASLQFLSASIDPHTLSEVSETMAMSTVLPEGKETETKTAETIPVDAVVRDFFSIEPTDPTLMAQASSASSSSTSSPATRSKQASAKPPEDASVPRVGQLYKKRSYSSSAVDDNTDYGSRVSIYIWHMNEGRCSVVLP
ncbi:unnamed protein product [Dibothriocephalus latus]|uniref:Uncharacterized protein n=1 Tax=Dibothriocephalus latus TaxID=60516 RepID=A0A3P7Q9Q0_DIBLA|nr:unnamed protein product [Dibothriocephalus latus]